MLIRTTIECTSWCLLYIIFNANKPNRIEYVMLILNSLYQNLSQYAANNHIKSIVKKWKLINKNNRNIKQQQLFYIKKDWIRCKMKEEMNLSRGLDTKIYDNWKGKTNSSFFRLYFHKLFYF